MEKSNKFIIDVDFESFRKAKKKKGKVFDLSSITGYLTYHGHDHHHSPGHEYETLEVSSTCSSVEIGVCMKNLGKYADQPHPPLFYFPNVGNFSYRNGNWFINNVSFYTSEGSVLGQHAVFGQDIGLTYTLMDGITVGQEVEFRIHFVIEYWEGDVLNSYACFIDPKLKVSQPPTPPPTV